MTGPVVFHRKKMLRIRDRHGEVHDHSHPLTDPVWVEAEAATHMRPDDPVLGLLDGGVPRALPWWIMKNHHAANLLLEGRPVLVTLCERCSGAAAFLSLVDGRQHTFRQVAIYNGTILLGDDETESLWSPFTGEALDGPLRGARLERLPLYQCTWGEWRDLYPDSLVPDGASESRDGHGSDHWPGKPGMGPAMSRTLVHHDKRLPHNELVLGVEVDGLARAYPLAALHRVGVALNDRLGGQEIVIFSRPHSLMAIAFSRWLEGACLEFEVRADGTTVDRQSGTRWDLAGRASFGPLAGRVLSFVPSGVEEWYVWAAYHPGAEIYELGRSLALRQAQGAQDKRRARFEERYAFTPSEALPWHTPEPPKGLISLLDEGFTPRRLLDLGCGSGAAALSLAGRGLWVVGLDLSLNAIRSARLLSQGSDRVPGLLVADALNLPFKRGAFDGIYDRGCFHNVPLWRRRGYRREVARILEPGGYFILQAFSEREHRARPLLSRLRRSLSVLRGRAASFITEGGVTRLFGRDFVVRQMQEVEFVTGGGRRRILKEMVLQRKEERAAAGMPDTTRAEPDLSPGEGSRGPSRLAPRGLLQAMGRVIGPLAAYHPDTEIFGSSEPSQQVMHGVRAWFEKRYALSRVEELPWHTPDPPKGLIGLLEGGFAPRRTLDLGCGSGAIALSLTRRGLRVVGLDFSLNAIRSARLLSQGSDKVPALIVADALRLPFTPGAFDAIYDRNCLPHIPLWRRRGYRREVARILEPGGYFILQAFSEREHRARPLLSRLRRDLSIVRGRTGSFITERGVRRLFGREFVVRQMQEVEFVTGGGRRRIFTEIVFQRKRERAGVGIGPSRVEPVTSAASVRSLSPGEGSRGLPRVVSMGLRAVARVIGPLAAYRLLQQTARLAVRLPGRSRWYAQVGARVSAVCGGGRNQALQVASQRLGTLLFARAVVACWPTWDGKVGPGVSLEGEGHLEKALAAGRGAILLSAHFGHPELGVLLLTRQGYRVVVGGAARWQGAMQQGAALPLPVEIVPFGGSPAEKVSALRQLRRHLTTNAAVLLLADGRQAGRPVTRPFLGGRLPVGMGAFILSQLAGSPILPLFVLPPQGGRPLEVRIHPPLRQAQGGRYRLETYEPQVKEFLTLFESYVRDFPGAFLSWRHLEVGE